MSPLEGFNKLIDKTYTRFLRLTLSHAIVHTTHTLHIPYLMLPSASPTITLTSQGSYRVTPMYTLIWSHIHIYLSTIIHLYIHIYASTCIHSSMIISHLPGLSLTHIPIGYTIPMVYLYIGYSYGYTHTHKQAHMPSHNSHTHP